jgi:hypothetical protein
MAKRIHQAPGKVWLFPDVPITGKRLIIDINGNPTVPSAGYSAWVTATAYLRGAKYKDGATPPNTLVCLVGGTSGANIPTTPANIGDMVIDGTPPTAAIWVNCGAWGALFGGATEGAMTPTYSPKNEEIGADQVPGPIDVVQTAEADEIDVVMKETNFAYLNSLITHGVLALGTDANLPSGSQAYAELAFGGIQTVPSQSVAVISPRRDVSGKFVVSQLWQAYVADAFKMALARSKTTEYTVKFKAIFDPSRTDMAGKLYKQL